MVVVAVVKVVVVAVVVVVVGKFACPDVGMSAQPAASFAQSLGLELVIWEFSRRGEPRTAQRERTNALPRPDVGKWASTPAT
jgi:hypothetical protein